MTRIRSQEFIICANKKSVKGIPFLYKYVYNIWYMEF